MQTYGQQMVVKLNWNLSKDCIMIFNDMSLGNESELDGQSYHNHWWFCREYGVPTDVNGLFTSAC